VVGCSSGSRGEVPGERKPVIRDDDDDDDDDDDVYLQLKTLNITGFTRFSSSAHEHKALNNQLILYYFRTINLQSV
jgi:hypothetical protein